MTDTMPPPLFGPTVWAFDRMGAGQLGVAAFMAHATASGFLHAGAGHTVSLARPLEMLGDLAAAGKVLGTFQSGGHTSVLVGRDGVLAVIDHNDYDCGVTIQTAGNDPAQVADEMDRLLGLFPVLTPITADEQSMYATYWFATSYGPATFRGLLPRMSWSSIEGNYSNIPRAENADGLSARQAFSQLVTMGAPDADAGRVLVLTGPAGTGKSRLLTALANEWAGWADLHVVSDPAQFFEDRSYLMSVAERFTDGQAGQPAEVGASDRYGGRWGIMVFEDADPYIDARQLRGGHRGDGISSLLNMADGMLGVSMRVMFVLTSNIATENIDPALIRPGRCMANIHVPHLSSGEAAEWLATKGHEGRTVGDDGASLATLYDLVRPQSQSVIVATGAPTMTAPAAEPIVPPSKRMTITNLAPRFSAHPDVAPIVASGSNVIALPTYPVEPPHDWFAKRQFSEVTPKRVSREGHLYGHIWRWGTPHIGMSGRRILPPRSSTGYAEFLLQQVICDDGAEVMTGPVYLNCDHAPLHLDGSLARDAMANTGTAWADVCIYEDEFGGQIAGAVRPTATAAMVRVGRGSDVSPDWRPIGRHRHAMYGMISVNTSGFNTALVASGNPEGLWVPDYAGPRIGWDHENDEPTAIVAVGMVTQAEPRMLAEHGHELASLLGPADLAELRDFLLTQRTARADDLMAKLGNRGTDLDARADAAMARLP